MLTQIRHRSICLKESRKAENFYTLWSLGLLNYRLGLFWKVPNAYMANVNTLREESIKRDEEN